MCHNFTSSNELLLRAARDWLSTPFRAHNRAKGPQGGVDCGNLIQEIMLECGFLKERLELPRLPLDYGQHNTASFVPDCDGQPSRCKAVCGNYARFRGFPFIPAENPVLRDSTANVDYGKK